MTDKTHWPFSGNIWAHGNRKAHRSPDTDEAKLRSADTGVQRQHVRHDRFIVGDRAHQKKAGLS